MKGIKRVWIQGLSSYITIKRIGMPVKRRPDTEQHRPGRKHLAVDG